MKILIWFLYLAVASVLSIFLVPLANTAATLEGSALFAGFITVLIYGSAIAGARSTCKFLQKRKGPGYTVQATGSSPQEVVEVYRPSKKRTMLSRPSGSILILVTVVCLLSIGFSAWSWLSTKSEYRAMAEETQESYENRIPAIRSAAYDDGYAAGLAEGESSDASIQRRLANLRDAAELEFYRSNAVFVTVSGEKYHCYGCHHLTGHRYFIYNIDLAREMGYEPCSDCWSW